MKKVTLIIIVFLLTFALGWQSVSGKGYGKYKDPWKKSKNGHNCKIPGYGKKCNEYDYVSTEPGFGRFCLAADGEAAAIIVSDLDYPGVIRAAGDLQTDIYKVTEITPLLENAVISGEDQLILIGTIGKSPVIDSLIEAGKLDVSGIEGKWETFLIQPVYNPVPGVESALVIAGSDQRGTIFGIYDLSAQIGVSPWHFWDDVPPQKKDSIYIIPGCHSMGEPAVKYRGFFINDENPSLNRFNYNYFGPSPNPDFPNAFGHELYAKVFEVMLRLKANYFWPAVWGRAFAEDDSLNHDTATYYGIVMGTSHEAPMMRGIEEWNRHATSAQRDDEGNIVEPGYDPYGGTGEWRYSKNPEALKLYWRDGIQRMVDEDIEGLVTLGMRGPGDVSLPVGDGIELIEEVIEEQRNIITEITGEDASATPQVWTLYKEVQGYWDAGIRVPDDVTVIWCDDNWGNLRKLPDLKGEERTGGYGIYYHFDYVGGGRNYKWIDTNLLPNIWEQLNLAYDYGVDRVWVVNVGDMKNEELPLQFFLDYAWDPEGLGVEKIEKWEKKWAKQQFGEQCADEIAEILHEYANLQSDRKPELMNRKITLNPDYDITEDPSNAVVYSDGCPFSLTDYAEMEIVTAKWEQLAQKAEYIKNKLPESVQDAYFQLCYYEVKASALMYTIRLAGFKNLLYLAQGRASTNDMADIAEQAFEETQDLNYYYNNELANGKWNGFQTQPYLAYGGPYPSSSWQQPETNYVADPDYIYPFIERIEVEEGSEMGVAIDGSESVWPDESAIPVLPEFSPFQTQSPQYIEVFNKKSDAFTYNIRASKPWVYVWPNRGTVEKEIRAYVRIDWYHAPKGITEVPITVTGSDGTEVVVMAKIQNPMLNLWGKKGFIESNGYVSMEADHYTELKTAWPVWWKFIPDIGRTGSGMTIFPTTCESLTPGENSPCLEYKMHLVSSGEVTVWSYLSPRNNVLHDEGLRYAVSIDDGEPQIVNITTTLNGIPMNKSWERNTSDNINLTSTTHYISEPGEHVLKFWAVDPSVVVQKIVVDTGGLKPSYLGPPESFRLK